MTSEAELRSILRELTVWAIGVTTDASSTQAERLADGENCWPSEATKPMRGSMLDRAIKAINERR